MRYLKGFLEKDLQRGKMVLLGGPRQVGKTTLALSFLGENPDESHPNYFNWDNDHDKQQILDQAFPKNGLPIILDEIHKYKYWRNFLKGLYDKTKSSQRYIVTGSARLDYYRHGGDSMFGRYFFYRLHPLSPGEVGPEHYSRLLAYSGFPEPFFSADLGFLSRWQRERRKLVFQEDLLGLERVIEISQLLLLARNLAEKVASIISTNSLAEDLSVSHKTIERWLKIMENLYFCFRISPWIGPDHLKTMKKEKKLYLWDWSEVKEEGPRFENMVGSFLLKYVHKIEDTEGRDLSLHFIRNKEKKEIDFLICENLQPLFAVEVKSQATRIDPNIIYFLDRAEIPRCYQVINDRDVHLSTKDPRVEIISADLLCADVLGI